MPTSPVTLQRVAQPGRYRWLLLSVVVGIAITAAWVYFESSEEVQGEEAVASDGGGSMEPIQPLETPGGLDPAKIDLGRALFHDGLLSHDGRESCASCHDLKTGGVDKKARSTGMGGAIGDINTPTVFNSGFNFRQFWDGRAATLENQVDGPIQSKIEMGSTWAEVLGKLKTNPAYVQAFSNVYRDDVNSEHVRNAIAEFERSLATPNSRFDRYLRHDKNSLTSQELAGYQLFKAFGCTSCHQGVGVGGNMYQKLGIMAPYFEDRGRVTRADRGRFNVTGDPKDLYMFKVPSLRNVELTAPYFHDGNAATLADAVRLMAKYQLGRPLRAEETQSIVAFLKTLTGQWNGKPL